MQGTDEQLYSRFLAENDKEAFGELMERYGSGLTLFLRGYVDTMEDAEDLMMDSFVVIVTKRSWTARGSSFKTWLFAIGRKLALRHNKKKQRTVRENRLEPGQPAGTPYKGSGTESLENELLQEERNRQLYRAMSRLHDDYREVLYLLYFEQMTYEEIGEIMHKNKRQLYHLAERGRSALKSELERAGFEYGE